MGDTRERGVFKDPCKLWWQPKTVLMWRGALVNVTRGLLFFSSTPPPMVQPSLQSQGHLILVASGSHSVGLLWTSHQPDAENSTWQDTTLKNKVHAPDVIRTRNPDKRAAADPRLYTARSLKSACTTNTSEIYYLLVNYTVYSYVYHTTWRHISEYSNLQLNVARAPNLTKTKNIHTWKKNPKMMVKKHNQAFNCIITPNSLGNISRKSINTV
jgi:hypothetical protein